MMLDLTFLLLFCGFVRFSITGIVKSISGLRFSNSTITYLIKDRRKACEYESATE